MQPEMQLEGITGAEAPAQAAASPRPWSLGTRIAFRFAFVYFALYTIDFPLRLLPFPPISTFAAWYNLLWARTVVWVSHDVLRISHNFFSDYHNDAGGSKDTTFIYVQVLCFFVVAVLATVIWSVWDRRRQSYPQLYKWFIVGLRLSLAAAMFGYGTLKMFPAQFPPPTLSKLLETYGDSSPMGLLWTFMGGSQLYTTFAGGAELLAAILLVIPRFAMLGALICVADLTNVLMLNFGYDVPVKLGTIHLLVIATIILLPDLGRLLDFLVLNRPVKPAPPRPLFQRAGLNRTAIALQIAFGLALFSYGLYRSHQFAEMVAARRHAPLYGIWLVDDFQMEGQTYPPLATDPFRWHRLIIESTDDATVQTMTGAREQLHLHPDPGMSGFTLTRYSDPNWIAQFTCDHPQPELLLLQGKIAGRPISMKLHREDESKFILNNRPFRWIQNMADKE